MEGGGGRDGEQLAESRVLRRCAAIHQPTIRTVALPRLHLPPGHRGRDRSGEGGGDHEE